MNVELPLPPQVFAIFNALFEERAGISYAPTDRELVAGKVSARALELGYETALDYYYFLRYDVQKSKGELDALIESLVVHETFFFRELDQLEVVVDSFIVPAVKAGRRARVWSAASSTGEEPLSIAMMLESRGVLGSVDIVASDISAAALTRARDPLHGRRSVRSEPPAYARRFLEHCDAGWRIDPRFIDAIDWRQVNLTSRDDIARVAERYADSEGYAFDVVLCRNVLFYFRDDTARRVVTDLSATLRPDGALFVGVAESLLRFGVPLECEEVGGVFLYRPSRTR